MSQTGTLTVVTRSDDAEAAQIHAFVSFYHEDHPDQLAARISTHIPQGAFLQVAWPIGRYRYVAEAEGHKTREGHVDLAPGANALVTYLKPRAKEKDDA